MIVNKRTLFTRKHAVFYLTIFQLLVSASLLAQEPDQTKLGIRGGAILGFNASQVDGDDYVGFRKVGLNGGFYAQIPVSRQFFFSTEILYSQQGAKSPTYQGIPLMYRSRFEYAMVPVIFHFQEKDAVNFGIGFSYGRLVGQKIHADEIPQPEASICTGKPVDVSLLDPSFICLRQDDFMILADGNYLFNKNFMVNVRYSYSIVPMGYFGSSNFRNRGMYNHVLSFRLMYVFGG